MPHARQEQKAGEMNSRRSSVQKISLSSREKEDNKINRMNIKFIARMMHPTKGRDIANNHVASSPNVNWLAFSTVLCSVSSFIKHVRDVKLYYASHKESPKLL